MADGYLIDEKDLKMYVDWCRDKMTSEKAQNWVDPDQMETFQDLKDELRGELDRFLQVWGENNTLPPMGEAGQVFHRLRQMASTNHEEDFSWHIWRTDDYDLTHPEDGTPIGYGGESLFKSTVLHGSALIKHTYSSKPAPVDLELSAVEVDGDRTVYLGSSSAASLDAISSVPWMDPTMDSSEFGNKLFNNMLSEDEWQRVVDINRVKDIGAFASTEGNYILNPVLLYVDRNQDSNCVKEKKKLNGEGTLEVNFDFLQERREGLTDYVPLPGDQDTRPIKIVDGQHRIRGMATSTRGHLLQVPFVLIVGENMEEDHAFIAKIFTEINTKSVQIDNLHKIYLSYKFGMKGRTPSDNFEIADSSTYPPLPTSDSRPQRRAYELALQMAHIYQSPMFDMIEFQKPIIKGRRRPSHIVVHAANWIHYVRKWFGNNQPYSDWNTDDFCTEEVLNFFVAFQDTCSTSFPEPRWIPGRGRGKPLLQFEGPFLSLLEVFPSLVDSITNNEAVERPISRERFFEALRPLTNVDWLSPSILRSPLKGRTNYNIRHLVMWMTQAIDNGEVFSTEDILDPNAKSTPGKGIIAPPDKSSIQDMGGVTWPGIYPIQLRCPHLPMTLTSGWRIRMMLPSGPVEWDPREGGNIEVTAGETQLSIGYDDIPAGTTSIEVEAFLANAISSTLTERRTFYPPDA